METINHIEVLFEEARSTMLYVFLTSEDGFKSFKARIFFISSFGFLPHSIVFKWNESFDCSLERRKTVSLSTTNNGRTLQYEDIKRKKTSLKIIPMDRVEIFIPRDGTSRSPTLPN